jgi:vacuolar-type H+-ATPase subunit E/Vma4
VSELYGNLDALVAQVRRRAEQRALAALASTEEQAKHIAEEGAERARTAARAAEAAGRVAVEAARKERQATLDTKLHRRRLEARERRLEKIWAAAEEALLQMASAQAGLLDHLPALARDAARSLGGDEVVVSLDAHHHAMVTADMVAAWAEVGGPALRLEPEPLARGHGLVARSGRATVDATVENRLQQARDRLRSEIVALLEAEP